MKKNIKHKSLDTVREREREREQQSRKKWKNWEQKFYKEKSSKWK